MNKTKGLFAQIQAGAMKDVREYSPLALAYIGDAVYEVIIRTIVMAIGNIPVNRYHQRTKAFVQAKGQAQFYHHIKDILTEKEADIFKRGRNAKSNSSAKNTDIITYRHATGLETLVGYLYVEGNMERITELITYGFKKVEEGKKNGGNM